MFTKLLCARRIQAICFTALVAVMIGASASISQAQTSHQGDQVVLTPGTVIPVTLDTEISSDRSTSGDTFTATVDTSRDAYNRILQGASVSGVVRNAQPREGNTPGTLDLSFNTLHLADGRSYPISGTPASLDTKLLKTRSDGVLEARTTKKDEHLTYAGIGAGAGALVGILGGGKLKIEDILLGGLAGYGVGSVLQGPAQVHDIDLKAGTPIGVLLGNRVGYYHQSQQGATSQNRSYHRTYTSNGMKHYWVNGQEWTMDMSTGERTPVVDGGNGSQGNRRYYSYQGHPYYLDTNTGERVRLD